MNSGRVLSFDADLSRASIHDVRATFFDLIASLSLPARQQDKAEWGKRVAQCWNELVRRGVRLSHMDF